MRRKESIIYYLKYVHIKYEYMCNCFFVITGDSEYSILFTSGPVSWQFCNGEYTPTVDS